ncbi:MAG: V-type ATPase 116kDa subunit family protein [Gammaproteobacteria bacterium]|nr:V-type ATPase 116kDa subunit family protein [Gammaproteobacteria bacterium]
MFRPKTMSRISLQVLNEDAPKVTLLLARAGVFDPEPVDDPEGMLPEQPAERYRAVYQSARARMTKLEGALGCSDEPGDDELRVVSLEELKALDARLRALWQTFSGLDERRHQLDEERTTLKQLEQGLQIFSGLSVDLGMFQTSGGFLTLRVGTVPTINLDRLQDAATLAGHLVTPFHEDNHLHYVVVAGPAQEAHEMDTLLHTASFRPVAIPAEFRDFPENIRQELDRRRDEIDWREGEYERERDGLAAQHKDEVMAACRTLHMARPFADLAQKLRGTGALAVVEGWIPRERLAELQHTFHTLLDRPFVFDVRDPRPDELSRVPTLVSYSWLTRPFGALVNNYGIPRYGELDPTLLFTASFIAMFGMMFGDIGHGAVIALAGIAMRRRFPLVTPFMLATGLCSVGFGFVYGSIFGYEHVIHPLWISPLSDPLLMLEIALYWGIGFILVANVLTIINNLLFGDVPAALLDTKGVAGIALYVGGIHGARQWLGGGHLGWLEMAYVIVPLATIMGFKWSRNSAPVGERMLIVAIDGFEAVMNYLANTLSFLRVAAFSLNHVALAVAVFTLAAMMDTTGHWITVVLGNIFIIVLEGAIVTIQTLRLEYYEGFSRFFRGDGREFRPLSFHTRA